MSAARQLADHKIPLLGVKPRTPGFLVDITPDDIGSCVAAVLDGEYEEDQRFLLSAQVGDQPPSLAFNDVVLHKWNIARMIEFETWIDGRFVNTQRSDGLIISTPTGSTAYALSVAAPLTPGLDAIALVPICPHTLSNRPIVIDAASEIGSRSADIPTPQDVRITCDGATSLTIGEGEKLRGSAIAPASGCCIRSDTIISTSCGPTRLGRAAEELIGYRSMLSRIRFAIWSSCAASTSTCAAA